MAAEVGSLGRSVITPHSYRRMRFGSSEPQLLAILQRLDPLVAVLALLLCALLFRLPFTPPLGALIALTFVLCGYVFGNMNRESELAGRPLSSVFLRILLEWAGVVCSLLLAGFAFKVTSQFSRLMILSSFGVVPISLHAAHALRLWVGNRIANSAHAPRYIIVGANNLGHELFRRLPPKGFLGFFDFRSQDRVAEVIDPAQLAGHCRAVAEFVRTHGVTSIYIALPLSNVPRVGEMIRDLRDTTASIYFVPDVFAFDLIRSRLVEVNGIPAIAVCDTPFYGIDAVQKRLMDIVFAGVALIALAPLMLVVALGVRLTSAGSILFRQRRYGLNGEEIVIYKFRTMTVCEDGSVVTQAIKHDQRVTRLGRILRATSLDELPQLLNVLQGKMSVVGPRPHAVAHNEQYRKLISGYMIRHKVRPGITGLAQVNGFRGATDTVEKMRERVRFDLEYVSHWSPWLDLKIIFRTILVLARDQNAY